MKLTFIFYYALSEKSLFGLSIIWWVIFEKVLYLYHSLFSYTNKNFAILACSKILLTRFFSVFSQNKKVRFAKILTFRSFPTINLPRTFLSGPTSVFPYLFIFQLYPSYQILFYKNVQKLFIKVAKHNILGEMTTSVTTKVVNLVGVGRTIFSRIWKLVLESTQLLAIMLKVVDIIGKLKVTLIL